MKVVSVVAAIPIRVPSYMSTPARGYAFALLKLSVEHLIDIESVLNPTCVAPAVNPWFAPTVTVATPLLLL